MSCAGDKSVMNLYETIRQTAHKYPGSPAVIYKTSVLTYKDLIRQIETAGMILKKMGIMPHDRVGLVCPNCPEYIILSFAIFVCRACVVPISEKLKQAERDTIVRDISLNALIFSSAGESAPIRSFQPFKVLHNVFLLKRFLKKKYISNELRRIRPAFIRFSSGTTGASKGIVLSHATILERTAAANKALKLTHDDTIVWLLPMSHHFAVSLVLYLIVGAVIVICDDTGLPAGRGMHDAIRTHNGTFIFAAPWHFKILSQIAGKADLKSVRLAVSTTAGLSETIFEDFKKKFGLPISQCYGIIEVGLPAINLGKPCEKKSSVGAPITGFRIKIIDPDSGKECKTGKPGAILVKGPGMLDAYFKPWRNRKHILKKGWFHTGDSGKIDSEGYLAIMGRSSNVINMAGLKFFPQEVESVLNMHPAVKESRVLAFNHPRWGEIPIAEAVLKKGCQAGEEELTGFCRKYLASFKIPNAIKFVDSIEKTVSDKIKRN